MKTLLRKCLDEIRKESPRTQYIEGILETLIELNGEKETRKLDPMPIIGTIAPIDPTNGQPIKNPIVAANVAQFTGGRVETIGA